MPPSSRGRHGRRAGTRDDDNASTSAASDSPSTPFNIWIKSFTNIERPLDGRLVELRGVVGTDTVESVKDRLQSELGVPREHQHLQFLGEDLRDWRTLAYYTIGAERVVAEEEALKATNQAKNAAERIIAEMMAEEAANQADEKDAENAPEAVEQDNQENTAAQAEAETEAREAQQKAEAELEAAREEQAAKEAERLANSNAKIPLILRVKTVDHAQALAVVTERGGAALQYVSPSLQVDKQIALAAVQHSGCALEHAGDDPELQGDKDVVLAAVQQSGLALEFAAESLREDLDVVLAAVAQNGHALQYAPKQLQADRQVVLEAVAQNGYALQYASAELQADRTVVLAAVTERGAAIAYASAPLRRDLAINRAAAESGWK